MDNTDQTPANAAPATDPGTATPQTGGTDAPATNAPAQQDTQPQSETVTIPQSEYARLQNHSHRFNGDRPLVEAALSAGIKNPDDFGTFVQAKQTLDKFGEAGQDPNRLLEMLNGNAPQQQTQQAPQGLDLDQVRDVVGSEFRNFQTQNQHDLAWKQMNTSLVGVVEELAGANASDAVSKSVSALVQDAASGILREYGHDSPLKGQYQPLSESEIGEIKTKVNLTLDALRGSQMRTNAAADPATAGQGGGLQSNTGGDGVAGADQRALAERSKADQVAAINAILKSAEQQHAQAEAGVFAGLGATTT